MNVIDLEVVFWVVCFILVLIIAKIAIFDSMD
jgi:hypothetical protein